MAAKILGMHRALPIIGGRNVPESASGLGKDSRLSFDGNSYYLRHMRGFASVSE